MGHQAAHGDLATKRASLRDPILVWYGTGMQLSVEFVGVIYFEALEFCTVFYMAVG